MKKGPSESPVPSPFPSAQWRLENKLQAQLDGAVAAGAEYGVEGGLIRGSATAAELTWHGGVGKSPLAICTGAAIRIREVGVIENVERLDAELCLHPFPELKVLANGEINVAETCIAEDVAAHSAKFADTVRDQHDIADHVAIASRV